MDIRLANSEDISQIVSVLKASLGEEEFPLTEEIWNYKHVFNPFGKSLVLVAVENKRIVGVRAFMRWQWQQGEKVHSVYRAVDTATHPHFQGKGIFKMITMKAVEMGIDNNDNFVFNTPNEQSRPGYLKMGWEEVGKVRVGIEPAFNSFWKIVRKMPTYEVNHNNIPTKNISKLCENWNKILLEKGKIFTPKSLTYLKWRYENNPLQGYEVFATSNFYIAGYYKTRFNIKELRISECIFNSNDQNLTEIRKIIAKWSFKFGVQVITFSPGIFNSSFSLKGNFGPVLTVRKLNLTPSEYQLVCNLKNWDYSLGDLELY